MDALKADDIAQYLRQPPGERLLEALQLMRDGIVLKRANLRRAYPDASEEALDAMLMAWMARE
jgi:hypothetical protein